MKPAVYAHPSLVAAIHEFAQLNGIDIAIVSSESCPVRILPGSAGEQCDLKTIYAGGWIPCQTALRLAEELAISPEQMGMLLNQLNVKVRSCSLGCFK